MGKATSTHSPSPLGRGCPAAGVFISRSGTGEGLPLTAQFVGQPLWFPDGGHKGRPYDALCAPPQVHFLGGADAAAQFNLVS